MIKEISKAVREKANLDMGDLELLTVCLNLGIERIEEQMSEEPENIPTLRRSLSRLKTMRKYIGKEYAFRTRNANLPPLGVL